MALAVLEFSRQLSLAVRTLCKCLISVCGVVNTCFKCGCVSKVQCQCRSLLVQLKECKKEKSRVKRLLSITLCISVLSLFVFNRNTTYTHLRTWLCGVLSFRQLIKTPPLNSTVCD